jgi:hypothetical protein
VHTPAGLAKRRTSLLSSSPPPLLPVMVWVHGGAFTQGGSNRPEYEIVADKNVVVVTLQYRLGALGFIVSMEDGLTGNVSAPPLPLPRDREERAPTIPSLMRSLSAPAALQRRSSGAPAALQRHSSGAPAALQRSPP